MDDVEPDDEVTKWVIYRTAYGELDYAREGVWDIYVKGRDRLIMAEVSRGHTLTEAINMIKLGSEDE